MSESEPAWDDEADVIVVGFGAAGACAALEAVECGADVLVVERFNGGGTTKMSGGVVYCGGGTAAQKRAGFDDTPENMAAYLKLEAKDVVAAETVAAFANQSVENLSWLEKHGVEFGTECCPFPTSYPIDAYGLYFSGNEACPPYSEAARPAPRGHRAVGMGLPGANFFAPLERAALKHSKTRVRCQSKVTGLLADSSGRITGVVVSSLPRGSAVERLHHYLDAAAFRLRYAIFMWSPFASVFRVGATFLESWGRPMRVKARKGVILASGGFAHSPEMLGHYAPGYSRGTPIGSVADDGGGIRLGQSVGGAVGAMNAVSGWRFINPPRSFVRGIFVDRQGKRICNEQLYGAKLGDEMVRHHDGKGFLIIDESIWRQAFAEIGPGKTQWFQSFPALTNLLLNNRKGGSVRQVAKRCGIDPEGLAATVESYNASASSGAKDPMGKAANLLQPLSPPFRAVNCSVDSRLFACAIITTGGLVVDEATGQVRRADGSIIEGLYAAGRTAMGLTSTSYVSGLSIADAVFSGRRAGRHAAARAPRPAG